MESLAIRYRPANWNELVEQSSIRTILENQLETKTFKQSYLFVGPAGTGKTTSARIFANMINNGQGTPIEIDAASHGNVDDIRELGNQAKLKPLDAEYKIFIIDECHCLSSAGWSAMLKLIEEPPATAIFIFCTTDVQKVPKTIMSRCQRFDFQRISQKGIEKRLKYILARGQFADGNHGYEDEAVEYIAKLSDGGLRDALTLLDKVIAFNEHEITLENVIQALGVVEYGVMIKLTDYILQGNFMSAITVIEEVHARGKDIKLFIKNYIQFLLDAKKYSIGCDWDYLQIPQLPEYEDWFKNIRDWELIDKLFNRLIKLQSDIKYSSSPKYDLEAVLLMIGE